MNRIILLIFILFFDFSLANGQGLSANNSTINLKLFLGSDSTKKHSAHKATIYSTIVPGLGQAYNKKYWKIPVIYACLGTLGYFIKTNADSARNFQKSYIAVTNNNKTSPFFGRYGNTSSSQLATEVERWKGYRDLSIIGFVAIYALNIIDAAVDAHLYEFPVNKNIAGVLKPKVISTSNNFQSVGLGLSFGLKF